MSSLTLEKLARKLRKQYTLTKDLCKGDIVIVQDTGWMWIVESITKEPNGFFTVLDEEGNGFLNVPGHELCIIIDRKAL